MLSISPCPGWLSPTVIKHWHKKLGVERVYYILSFRVIDPHRRKLMTGTETSPRRNALLLACSVWFLLQPRTSYPEKPCPLHSLIEKILPHTSKTKQTCLSQIIALWQSDYILWLSPSHEIFLLRLFEIIIYFSWISDQGQAFFNRPK